jgi:hypothetical protein
VVKREFFATRSNRAEARFPESTSIKPIKVDIRAPYRIRSPKTATGRLALQWLLDFPKVPQLNTERDPRKGYQLAKAPLSTDDALNANSRPRPMLPFRLIKSLYPLALAEGEGIGTAYEYFAKRLVLAPWLAKLPRPRRLLIAGLPEKYGSSLDFILLAQDMGVPDVVVIDDRAQALEKGHQSLAAAQSMGELTQLQPHYELVADMGRLEELAGFFDLCLTSEVLQRLDPITTQHHIGRLAKLTPALALFAPNADNRSHTTISGLSGLRLTDLQALLQPVGVSAEMGYVDMPPFPPGLTRSAEQRSRAASGRFEGLAMWMLSHYARRESWFSSEWRRRQSHIAYALVNRLALN